MHQNKNKLKIVLHLTVKLKKIEWSPFEIQEYAAKVSLTWNVLKEF